MRHIVGGGEGFLPCLGRKQLLQRACRLKARTLLIYTRAVRATCAHDVGPADPYLPTFPPTIMHPCMELGVHADVPEHTQHAERDSKVRLGVGVCHADQIRSRMEPTPRCDVKGQKPYKYVIRGTRAGNGRGSRGRQWDHRNSTQTSTAWPGMAWRGMAGRARVREARDGEASQPCCFSRDRR